MILQHHDQIVTASDMGLSVACQYDLTNKSVSNEVDLGVSPDLKHSITQESIVDSPNVAMRVTDRRGESTGSAQVGLCTCNSRSDERTCDDDEVGRKWQINERTLLE